MLRHAIIPLMLMAILLDVIAMTFWTFISPKFYYVGESVTYLLWIAAFWIRNRYNITPFQAFCIDTALLMWLTFSLNTVYKNVVGDGGEANIADYVALGISVVILIVQIRNRRKLLRKARNIIQSI